MSKTPRTSKCCQEIGASGIDWHYSATVMMEHAKQLETELAASQAQVARLRDSMNEILLDTNGRNPAHIGQDRAFAIAKNALRETNPNATVPVTSRGRWDSKPYFCTVCGQNPVNPHEGFDTCNTCNP